MYKCVWSHDFAHIDHTNRCWINQETVKLAVEFTHHLFDTTVEAHCVRDNGTNANQWLTVSDWLRVGVV